ncbi:MAG: sigma-54 dependent transcriptional regulator [Bacteroidales bacterium]|nr:sigma-54 dependent transcriptional regulator [Bacteroidales bacterium]
MNENINNVKRRFGIIGFDPALDHVIDVAMQVAVTDLSVLVTGESGSGKESVPKIIHAYSPRKTKTYIAVNCGAIPEGTIDSELFGHEKGAFTGAVDSRKGYFEEANGGTLFLDEVADLPLSTQVRLLRVLETGEYIRVGSSKVMKTDVRVVAATNVNIADRIAKGKFREDLYYRLNSVPIRVPALRERPGDIYPLFVKFAADFSDKYHFPTISLTGEAQAMLRAYRWPGNVRQLKNVTEQVSLIEKERMITPEMLKPYLTGPVGSNLPAVMPTDNERQDNMQREIVFKFIAELQREVQELKSTVMQLTQNPQIFVHGSHPHHILPETPMSDGGQYPLVTAHEHHGAEPEQYDDSEVLDDASDYSMEGLEKNAIIAALRRNKENRKLAAQELGISERTLYRKIKEYGI